ncbi:MAG: prepilin-type N-terminal cleavage/methylation domain-containing protein [Candidatus Sumerlaeota bacterium]|nr:prepilin-type N-terminal cleavage/methylation domain-containing protein [Candidatus Sumerlaeota bacterium]
MNNTELVRQRSLKCQATGGKRAFTLIELLIVIAIIAILALIAIPNFLEAQTRSKVSRAKADLRTMKLGMEAYAVDWNDNPPDNFPGQVYDGQAYTFLTTPVAYLSSIPGSAFKERINWNNMGVYEYWRGGWANGAQNFDPESKETGILYRITSRGPDGVTNFSGTSITANPNNTPACIAGSGRRDYFLNGVYDPTNGTISSGDIIMWSGGMMPN